MRSFPPLPALPRLQVRQLQNPRRVYTQLMDLLGRLAGLGLVHCDYNEFNVLVRTLACSCGMVCTGGNVHPVCWTAWQIRQSLTFCENARGSVRLMLLGQGWRCPLTSNSYQGFGILLCDLHDIFFASLHMADQRA
jgi:hypothetical protein